MINKIQTIFTVSPKPIADIKDIVGAGGLLGVVTLMGIINQWDKQLILEKATEFASKICMVPGALLHEPESLME